MDKCFESVLERVQYMAEVAKIQAMKTTLLQAADEIKSLRNELADGQRDALSLIDQVVRLTGQLAECQKDAARWKFVMMTEPYANNLWKALPKNIYNDSRHLSSAIDSAMGE